MTASVLVLDDREADRSLLATVLGYAGYEVIEAESGEKALGIAHDLNPDLIITDILMPGMNGYEFVRRLRDDPIAGQTCVVFTTANYVEDEVRRLADACGVSSFLAKPAAPDQVLDTVAGALGNAGAQPGSTAPMKAREFDREQTRVLNDKLVEKVTELERVSAERQELIVQLLRAQEEERHRIAAALHDDPIQEIAVVSMRLGGLAERIEGEDHEMLDRLRTNVTGAIDRMRELVFELEPTVLRSQGLAAALRMYAERTSTSELEFALKIEVNSEPESETRTFLYRMAAEAIANVEKHAEASRVEVQLARDGPNWLIRVTDDGRGLDPVEALRIRPGHLGLPAMRERLQIAGGSLRIESSPGEGATVEIRLPDLPSKPR